MATPITDQEGRRWHSVYNPMDKEIPAFASLWCGGKRFDGDWDEKRLPTDISRDSKLSWSDLQKKVGYGNLLLVAQLPYAKYGWHYYNDAGIYHNGPTAIAPRSWGRVTRDYPTIARVRITDKHSSKPTLMGYSYLQFTPRKNSFDLTANVTKWGFADTGYAWSWGFGWGMGFGWGAGGYGQVPRFQIVDMVKGYNSSEGLAWVTPGNGPPGNSAYEVHVRRDNGSLTSLVDPGWNDFEFDVLFPTGLGKAIEGSHVFAKDGWLQITQPGMYTLDLNFSLEGSGSQAPGEQNPWSQLLFSLEHEYKEVGGADTRVSFEPAMTLAPPVIKQGFYGAPSTYLTHYEYSRCVYYLIVNEPKDYDPMNEDPEVLAKWKLKVHRATNAPNEMTVIAQGRGPSAMPAAHQSRESTGRA